jgi:hypothetical protein
LDNTTVEIARLYVALFGRAPDRDGLSFWSTLLQEGSTLDAIASAMFATAPARTYYPTGLDNEALIRAFYVNVLGRDPDPNGLSYWVSELLQPGASTGTVIQQMIDVVANYSGLDPAGQRSAMIFNERAHAAAAFAENNGSLDTATQLLDYHVPPAIGPFLSIPTGGSTWQFGVNADTQTLEVDAAAAPNNSLMVEGAHDGMRIDITSSFKPYESLQIIDVKTAAAQSLSICLDSPTAIVADHIYLSGVQNLHIESSDPSSSGIGNRMILTAWQIETVTITGNANLDLDFYEGHTNLRFIDARSFTGNLNLRVANASEPQLAIACGPGNDVVSSQAASSVIDGGDGNDTLKIVLAGTHYSLTGGAGADTFDINIGSAGSTINDFSFAQGDSLQLMIFDVWPATARWHAEPVVLNQAATYADYVNAASSYKISDGSSDISWFVNGGNTFIVMDSSPLTTLSSEDIYRNGVIELVGVVDLSTAVFDNGVLHRSS